MVKLLIRPSPPTGPVLVLTSGQVAARHQGESLGGSRRWGQEPDTPPPTRPPAARILTVTPAALRPTVKKLRAMRSAKDFFRPLAVGAPAPLREIPARPSRAIHFFDPSNPKMAAKVPDMVGTVDVLLGNLEDAVKAENKDAARDGLVEIAKETDLGEADPAVDPRQRPRLAVGSRRPHHADHRDRRRARRRHGAEGRGRRGHPLRRPAAGPARGEGRAGQAADGPRDPRDRPRDGQRRGDLRGLPADAGHLPGSGRHGGGPAHEDHPRRGRPPGLPRAPGPADGSAEATRPSGRRTSRTSGTTRSRAWSTPA